MGFIIISIILWFVCGIIAFFIEVKQDKIITFDNSTKKEFFACLALGIISLFVICEPFKNLMEFLMRKINSK